MKDFFTLMSSSEVFAQYRTFSALEQEEIPLSEARDRILATDIDSPEFLPSFSRSSVDGFAVRAQNTFGCSESEPALLQIVGEISMGESGQDVIVEPGQTARIWTGGELPAKADSVVMVEYSQLFTEQSVAIYRPVAPKENVIDRGEDYTPGKRVLSRGRRLLPQDTGVLAGLGITRLPVYKKPRVAIISTGDELISPQSPLQSGKIRDINATSLAALIEESGGTPRQYGICGDDFNSLLALSNEAIAENDMLLLSGGSSVGRRDFTLQVLQSIQNSRVLVHGIAIRPGKPTILAQQGNKALFGLPGHVASSMVVFYLFVRPLLHLFSGCSPTHDLMTIPAITEEQIPSAIGREEYIRVSLSYGLDGALPKAAPIYGKSGLLSSLVEADGLLAIDRNSEGLAQGEIACVYLFPHAAKKPFTFSAWQKTPPSATDSQET